jgi:hypothetical protein
MNVFFKNGQFLGTKVIEPTILSKTAYRSIEHPNHLHQRCIICNFEKLHILIDEPLCE